jgi:predicted secreted protein
VTFNATANSLHPTPFGHVHADQAEQAQRDAMRLVILAEREQAAKAALEAEITERLNALRGIGNVPAPAETDSDSGTAVA